jgi:hypothetical protein
MPAEIKNASTDLDERKTIPPKQKNLNCLAFLFSLMKCTVLRQQKTVQRLGAQPEWDVRRGCGNPQPRSKQAAYSVPPT